jgi:photosystem II stability/assembly factor-like uncharacterized protein
MKSPLSFSPRQALLLVILVAVAGLLLARQFSNRVPVQPTAASGSAATETPVNPAPPASSGIGSDVVASDAVATFDGAQSGEGGSTSTEMQGTQVATAGSASQTQVVSERAEAKQEVEEPAQHSTANERDRGEQKGEKEEKERKQDQPDEAMKWRMGSLVDETGKIPEGAEVRAWLHTKQMPIDPSAWPVASLNLTDTVAGISPASWQWLGPGNIGGRVRSIIIHPSDPQTLWLGSVSGGIWKTTDGGASWAPLADFLTNLAVSSMVIDPTNPKVLYAGTGEGYFNGDSIRGAGVFKTTDGGATWNQLPQTAASPNWYYVDRLAISPADNQVILAATRSGIWRSSDGGTTWSRRLTTSFMFDINFDPTDPSKAIASGDNGAVRYSTDGGLTWNPATGISGSRIEVAYARSSPNIVYASVESGQGQIYKSTDGGQSYSLVNGNSLHLQDQGWYDNALWVDPTDPNNVIIGGIRLYRSTNSGANFSQIGNLHADQHIIIEAPGFDGVSNKMVYFGNDGGIFRTTDINAGFVITQELNNNLGITQFYSGAGNVSNGRIIGGTQDNGTLRYTGNTEAWNFMAGGDGGWTAADQTNPNYFYGEFQWLQLHRSINGGTSSQAIYEGITDAVPNGTTNFIAPFVLDPNNPNTLLAGGATLWRTTNAKGFLPLGWTAIKSSIGSNISAIAVANGNSDIVWVGHNNGNIFVTTNGTAASPIWTQVNMPATGRRNTRITIDPTNSNRVYVTFGGYAVGNVWRTDNAGASFTNITNNLPIAPVRSLVVWQNNPNYLYVGTEVGVFASANGGQTWSPSNDGPTNCSVDELFWMGNTLVAATHGRGMFSINLSTGQPPSVSLTSPANGAGFNGGAQVTIAADANDADGTVTKVDFFANNTLIGTATTAPYSVVWNNVPVGTHILMARAADNSANTALSTAININVSWAVCLGTPISLGQTILGSHAETDCSGPIGNRNDSYLFNANAGQAVAITMTAAFFDTRLVLIGPNGAEIASDDNGNGGTDSRIPAGSGFITLPSTGTYTIVATSAVVGLQSGGPYALTLAGGPAPSTVQFDAGSYLFSEGSGAANLTLTRAGSTAAATSVDYRTSDTAGLNNCNLINGIASAQCDYATSVGTVRFAAGETLKTISIPIVDDSYAEGNESFTVTLSNVTGASLGSPAAATVTINDNEATNGPNPIDGTAFFVRQQYVDFLGREPDPAGNAAWQSVVNNCPAGDTTCDRIHVSSAFFRSAEFQDRGYFVYRLYPVSFGRKPEVVEFTPDIAKVSGFLSDAELEAAKVAFIAEFMSRPAFVAKFNGLTNTQYVDTLLSTAQVTSPHRDFYIAALGNGTRTRATVLRDVSESSEVYNKYFNQAFVVMQYFGYLRRDPDALHVDWIAVLDSSGDYRGMVNGFMNSLEYRFRFGP